MTILERVHAVFKTVDRELFEAEQVSSLLWLGSPFCDEAFKYLLKMIFGQERRDMGLNSRIVKNADNAGVSSATAGFGWINDDRSDRSIPRREAQPDGSGQNNRGASGRDDQPPSATQEIEEFAKVQFRRLSGIYNFV